MSANTWGHRFKVTTFGESHGAAYGVVIDGMPSGVKFDLNLLLKRLEERRPGKAHTTSRNESDQPEVLSGIYEGKTLGTPISVVIRNHDTKSADYQDIKASPRIGHADDTWLNKYGHVDHRGGGRSSGRETVCRVVAGAFAEMMLKQKFPHINVVSYSSQIGPFKISHQESALPHEVQMFLQKAKEIGESYGGVAECLIQNAPPSLGQPVFYKFKADLAHAMLGIGATTGFEFGEGFRSVEMPGTEFHSEFRSQKYGGIRGGITTGESIHFRVAFKPTSSIKDVAKKGRHDPCIVPRALPVVSAMAWLVLADHYLWSLTDQVCE